MSPFIWLLGAVVFPYVAGPILIHRVHRAPRHPRWRELQPDRCSPGVVDHLLRRSRELQADGFQTEAMVTQEDGATETHVALLTNRSAGDKAMVVAILARGGGRTFWTFYTEFSTRYDNGWNFDTMNSKTLGAFRRSPEEIKSQVPMLEDSRRLYELHRYVLAKHQNTGRKVVYEEGTALPYLTRVMTESFEDQVKAGLFYVDEPGDAFRLTWKGACLLSWGLLFPAKQIRTLRMNSRGWTMLREYERWARQRVVRA